MAGIDEIAATIRAVQAELPIAEALAEADRIDEALHRVAALEGESRNKLLTEASDHLLHARDTLRRTAGHWGTAGSHLDEYLIEVLGLAPAGLPTVDSTPQIDPGPLDRSTPPGWPDEPNKISTQKQSRHVLGTREYAQRKDGPRGDSAFFNRELADRLCWEAWERGNPRKGKEFVREHDFGYPVGVDGQGRYQTRVRVHMDHTGRLHGHPCGPGITRQLKDLS